ncbi:MAG TPA: response regulator transcription factor [Acidobacteriota bacterium]|nr:response regulator transcription factor [Acidobacteriota bacterium]HNH82431.1 response regulator transcription factor [Acidobacteriota bacterium]HNJ40236.1 response regulator transcription factor [Acidobacteriota bacterium]
MSTEPELHIIIADDHPIFRRGLHMIIEADPRLKVVAEADDGAVALAEVKRLQPHVVVLDMDMPVLDGMGVAREILQQRWPVEIAFLTMHKEELIFNAALDLGVKGYVVKDSAATEIVDCIKAIASGQSFISPVLSGLLLNRVAPGTASKAPGLSVLTPAERRVLRLIADSKLNTEIAAELFVSVRTVEHHRSNICSKLGLNGKHALLTFALTHKSEI